MDPFIAEIHLISFSYDFEDLNLNFEKIKHDGSAFDGAPNMYFNSGIVDEAFASWPRGS